jgi:hypothetical protein
MGRLHDKAAWRRRARRQLQYEPLCAMCLSEGKIVAARIADHVEPHHDDPIKFWNGKLQSLCLHSREPQETTRTSRARQCDRSRWLADRSQSPSV